MKHPILHVRKGVERYEDEEESRERARSIRAEKAEPAPRQGGLRALLRRSRGSLLPILILALAVIIILRVMPRSTERANIDGWRAQLQAQVLEDGILVGVAFSRLPGVSTDLAAPQAASAAFLLPATGEQLVVSGSLSGQRSVLRGRMRYSGSEKMLEALVRVGTESRRLFLSVHAP